MEDALNEEVQKLIDFLKPSTKKPMTLNHTINVSILNALWFMLVGEKWELSDPKPRKIIELIDEFIRTSEGPTTAISSLCPWPDLLLLPGFKKIFSLDVIGQMFDLMVDLIQPLIETHKSTLDEENVRDFMDLYLKEVNNTSGQTSSFYK